MVEENHSDAMIEHAKELQRLADNSHRILTPPTSEDHDGNSSELSEIEDEEEEDIGDITPDHYWDEENGGKIPVFKPVGIHTLPMTLTIVAIPLWGL